MSWNQLTSIEQIAAIKENSKLRLQLIFKHSTRCSVSSMSLSRMERAEFLPSIEYYFLDLIAYREVSNFIAEAFHVHHESPQVLIIKNGECVYDESHMGISTSEIEEQAQLLAY